MINAVRPFADADIIRGYGGGGDFGSGVNTANTITLTQAEFDALLQCSAPPGREIATCWKIHAREKWFLCDYIDGQQGFLEIRIREIVVEGCRGS